jgi:hypothetical protein
MRRSIKFAVAGLLLVCVFSTLAFARNAAAEDDTKEASSLAKSVFEAHGGKILKELTSLLVTGSVDVTASAFQQAIPATFSTAFQGEKYLLEVNSSFAGFRQSFDGTNTYTAPDRGFSLPPINRIGIELLKRLGDDGYIVSNAAEKNGFRITSPEGYFTDFYPDKKTSLIKSYEAAYVVGGRNVTTLVEIKKYEVKDGVSIPSKYDQRFEVAGMTVYASFKAKEITLNSEIPAETFGNSK